jgi:hypothetical protein
VTPPFNPALNQLWWNSDGSAGGGQLYVYYNDGNSTQWVPAAASASTGGLYLPLAGGTMTGPLVVPTVPITQNDNTVATTAFVRTVIGGPVDVHWYGAVGDGVADDTAAWNNALAAGDVCGRPGKTYLVKNINAPTGAAIDLRFSILTAAAGADYCLKLTGYGSHLMNGSIEDGTAKTVRNTTVATAAVAAATTITVAATTGFVAGNIIFVKCDSGPAHVSRISSVTSSTITLMDGLPASAAVGRDVASCRGLLVIEDMVFGTVENIVFANQPLAVEFRSAGSSHGCGKNSIHNLRIDYTQLGGVVLFDDVYDNDLTAIQSWGGSWTTIGKSFGFYLDARNASLLTYGANRWTACSSLAGDYGLIVQKSEYGFFTACNFDSNNYWGIVLDNGANKNQFANQWCASNGGSGGGGVKSQGTSTIENIFNGLQTRFNGPSQAGPDISIASGNTMYVDDSTWRESRVLSGTGTLYRGSGDYTSAQVDSGSPITLTSATAQNITSISLTPGDYDVGAQIEFTGQSTTIGSFGAAAISTTSGSVPDQRPGGYLLMPWFGQAVWNFGSSNVSYAVPPRRFSVSVTTTIYLNVYALFSAGVLAAYGSLSARRWRSES